MNHFLLEAPFQPTGDQPQAIKALVESRPHNATLLGVTGSGKTFTIANLIAQTNRQVIILSPNKTLAAQLYEEFFKFFPHNKVCYFVSYYDYYQPESYLPATDQYIPKETRINQEIDRMRIESVAAAINRTDTIIIASVSCIYSLGNPYDFRNLSFSLTLGEKISLKEITKKLVEIEYIRNDYEKNLHGTFQVFPSAIEIILPYQKEIVRIEFDHETVSYLSWLKKETREVVQTLDTVLIMPAKYFVTTTEKRERGIKSIIAELDSYLPTLTNPIYRERLESRVMKDVELIGETGTCQGIENYSAHFENRLDGKIPYTLFDFCQDPLIVIDESHLAIAQLKGMFVGDRARKNTLIEYGFRLPSARENRPLQFSEIEEKLKNTIFVSATPGEYEIAHSKVIVEQIIRPTGIVDPVIEILPRENQLKVLKQEIQNYIEKGLRTLITVMTKKLAEELAAFFEKQAMKVCYIHHAIKTPQRTEILHKLRSGEFDCLIGINLLREGLDLPEVGLVAIMDADIESFLRDKRSLIQTIGRAARNTESKVLLFADKITYSMDEAIRETARRREIQTAYNEKHHITPKTTVRAVSKSIIKMNPQKAKKTTAHAEKNQYESWTESKLHKEIKLIEKKMIEAAKERNLAYAKELKTEWEKMKKAKEKK
jgi:excinuclease ABC subunit B